MKSLNSSWIGLHGARAEDVVSATTTEVNTKVQGIIANSLAGNRRGGVLVVRLDRRYSRQEVPREYSNVAW